MGLWRNISLSIEHMQVYVAAIPADVVLVEDVIVLLVKTVPKMASTLTLQLLLGAAGMV